MKTKLTKTIMSSLAFTCASGCLVAAMALDTPGTAPAAPQFPRPCSVRTLNGLYLWTLDGYQNFGGNPVPKDLMHGLRFNGDGTLTVPFGTINIGGTIVIDASGGVGTYTVAADCTGTFQIANGPPSFNMYVGPGAQQLWIIQTVGGPGDGTGLGLGTATRLPW
jgi:hypothetical protein